MNKLKDVAGLLKAKITKDQLEEALINATSQQNWQASTHILHEIANAAYNYQKWQQINQFIWDKLKKGKSWRKILKTLNLVQFLLKNGPPSIVSSFKYDIYQFRSFDNFSHYDDGIDRGQSIRQRAKAVVDLLSNEQLLQQERVKAKTIRERMSGVVTGSNYGGHSGKQSGISGGKYGSIDNKSYQSGGFTSSNTQSYNQGGLGVYGDYNTTKSTLDKYKDNKTVTTSTTIKKPTGSGTITAPLVQNPKDQDKQMIAQNKKPFQSIAPKLVKPGSKPAPKQQTTNVSTTKSPSQNIIDDDDIFGNVQVQPTVIQQPVVQQTVHQPVQQPIQVQQPAQHVQQQIIQNGNPNDFGFTFDASTTKPQINQPVTQPQQHIQPQVQHTQPLYQQANTLPTNLNLGFNNPNMSQQQPNMYAQQGQFGYGQQQPNQFGMMGGYQQPMGQQGMYGQQGYQQQMMQGQMGYNQGFGQQVPQYQQPQVQYSHQQQAWGQGISLSTPQQPQQPQQVKPQQNFGGISLQTTTSSHQKKDEDEFGNFASGQNNNVKWLTSEQKGLIDFSDFGDELKNGGNKQQKSNNNNLHSNNIDTTWTW